MLFRARSKFIRVSPFKIRPIANVVRGYSVEKALSWLKTCSTAKRVRPLEKVIFSAYSNAKQVEQNLMMNELLIKEIRVDQGPTFRYHQPSAMGRAAILRRRISHLEVVLEKVAKKSKQR